MRILWKRPDGECLECVARVPNAEAVWVQSDRPMCCPCCGWTDDCKEGQEKSFAIWSRKSHTGSHTVTGTARCAKCAEEVGGELVVELDTIFGLDEDRAVLNGRPRVYG